MNKENNIIIKNTTVMSLSDWFNKKEVFYYPAQEYSNSIYSIETILYQNLSGQIPRRSYTLIDMITAQKMLALFDLLETVKYKEHLINCRPLLHKYLYSGYVLNDCFLNKATADFHLHNEIDIEAVLSFGNSIYTYEDEKNSLCYPKSIRNYFERYLKNRNECPAHLGYNLITSAHESGKAESVHKPRYYLPINQIPEFLLAFAFFDGRIFPSTYIPNTSSRIPKLDSKKQKAETSYKFVLQQITIFLNNHKLNNYEKLSHTYRLDKLFLFRNLNRLNHYYNTYISDIFLDRVIRVFELSYKEIAKLEESIIEYIWGDHEFILAGHQSSFIDFMLPFDIHFQYFLFCNEIRIRLNSAIESGKENGLEGLKKTIGECKEQARRIWALPLHADLQRILSLNDNRLDIKLTQDKIIELLNTNSFYITYFTSENEYVENYNTSSMKLQQPISYDILKKLLPQ